MNYHLELEEVALIVASLKDQAEKYTQYANRLSRAQPELAEKLLDKAERAIRLAEQLS